MKLLGAMLLVVAVVSVVQAARVAWVEFATWVDSPDDDGTAE